MLKIRYALLCIEYQRTAHPPLILEFQPRFLCPKAWYLAQAFVLSSSGSSYISGFQLTLEAGDISVGIVTKLYDMIILTSLKGPDQLWCPRTFQFIEYQGLLPLGQGGQKVKLTTLLHLVLRLRIIDSSV